MTSFDSIEDLALIVIRDYKIDSLAQSDPTAFQTYLDGFLISAIPNFTASLTDLSYDLTTRQLSADLTNLQQKILACLLNVEWMTAETQNITQFNLHLQNKEYKVYSEAENLKQKVDCLDKMREKAQQLATEYQLLNISSIPYYSNMNII